MRHFSSHTSLGVLRERRDFLTGRLLEITCATGQPKTPGHRDEAQQLAADVEAISAEIDSRDPKADRRKREAIRNGGITGGDHRAQPNGNGAGYDFGAAPAPAELVNRASLMGYIEAASNGTIPPPGSAEGELNRELNIPDGRFALDVLGRGAQFSNTATDANTQIMPHDWLRRMIGETAIARLGIMPTIATGGDHAFPQVLTGAAAKRRGREEAADESSWTVSVATLTPARSSSYITMSSEDMLRVPGLDSSLEEDTAMEQGEHISRTCIEGDTGANEDRGDIAGILGTTGITVTELKQNDKVKFLDTGKAFTGLLDGKFAASMEDVNVLAYPGAARLWEDTTAHGDTDLDNVANYLREQLGVSWTITPGETDTTNGKFGAVMSRARGLQGAARLVLWREGEILVDRLSQSHKGVVRVVINSYWNFKVVRAANFAAIKFVT